MQQNDQLKRILDSKTKNVEDAHGILSKIFRQIMYTQGVGRQTWGQYMKQYLTDPRNRIPQNSKDISSARGNMVKELLRPNMTWKVFLKGLRFMNPKAVRLRIELDWHNNTTTTYDLPIHEDEVADDDVPEVPVAPPIQLAEPNTQQLDTVTEDRILAAIERQRKQLEALTKGNVK